MGSFTYFELHNMYKTIMEDTPWWFQALINLLTKLCYTSYFQLLVVYRYRKMIFSLEGISKLSSFRLNRFDIRYFIKIKQNLSLSCLISKFMYNQIHHLVFKKMRGSIYAWAPIYRSINFCQVVILFIDFQIRQVQWDVYV